MLERRDSGTNLRIHQEKGSDQVLFALALVDGRAPNLEHFPLAPITRWQKSKRQSAQSV